MWRMLAIFVMLFLTLTSEAHAIYDPLSVPNNRFGIHIIDENDLDDAAKLVNSTGGDWGYVKIVIREDDRNLEKWQAVFDKMRRLHLIPLVRLATKVEHGMWVKPRVDDIGSWVDFLSSLNWVIENRYIIVFNEPNHAKEWGGEINPSEYARFLKELSTRLKEKSEDFFILPAGLDASAPNGTETMDELVFIKSMVTKDPNIFDFIDGWSSHSYPNPDFSGSPFASGRGSVRTFQWELSQLTKHNVSNLPVFITETGWKHSQGKEYINYTSPQTVADNFSKAFTQAWSDSRLVAVTPFLLNYQDALFDHFSWRKFESSEFYPVYEEVQSLVKVRGQPRQHHGALILTDDFPTKLVTSSDYTFSIELENTGQSIVSSDEGWQLSLQRLSNSFEIIIDNIQVIEPGERTKVEVKLKTPEKLGVYPFDFVLKKNEDAVAKVEASITLVPPPSLLIYAKIWFNRLATGSDYSLLLYDKEKNLIHEVASLEFDQGFADVENLRNVVPNQSHRLILSKPYYVSRELRVTLTQSRTGVAFPMLLPLDPSNDGKLSISDLGALFKRPLKTVGLLMSL